MEMTGKNSSRWSKAEGEDRTFNLKPSREAVALRAQKRESVKWNSWFCSAL